MDHKPCLQRLGYRRNISYRPTFLINITFSQMTFKAKLLLLENSPLRCLRLYTRQWEQNRQAVNV